MRRAPLVAAVLVVLACTAHALEVRFYRFDPKGRVRAVRALDVDGDGKKDLVLLVEPPHKDGPASTEVLILKSPSSPDPKSFFRAEEAVRIQCDGPEAKGRATAGAVAVGRFLEKGGVALRFLGETVEDVLPTGAASPLATPSAPTLLARSPSAPVVFWDAVGDLDGDGVDECWYPGADGKVVVGGVVLPLVEDANRSATDLCVRKTRVPSLVPVDLDGDGKKELAHLDGTTLVVEHATVAGAPATPPTRVDLPFLVVDPNLPPEEIRTPRLTLLDVDGDKKTDLLVTMVHGRADQVGGLRTSLYHYPGPFITAKGALVDPRGKIDTESVALHPRFVDVTGDGTLDYVADSIRGSTFDLVRRVMGTEPEITFTIFRFDRKAGRFESEPYTTFVRPYSSAEARSNTFGRSGFFEGDFDGDGIRDLLDLGNLKGLAIWRGGDDEDAFKPPLLKRVEIPKDRTFAPEAVVVDLNGDGRADAVAWTEDELDLVVSAGNR